VTTFVVGVGLTVELAAKIVPPAGVAVEAVAHDELGVGAASSLASVLPHRDLLEDLEGLGRVMLHRERP
jgi:hypothetical protein